MCDDLYTLSNNLTKGVRGPKGLDGITGPTGDQGTKGDQGDQGTKGPKSQMRGYAQYHVYGSQVVEANSFIEFTTEQASSQIPCVTTSDNKTFYFLTEGTYQIIYIVEVNGTSKIGLNVNGTSTITEDTSTLTLYNNVVIKITDSISYMSIENLDKQINIHENIQFGKYTSLTIIKLK